ncbi:MAG TPA: glycosyltransferase family 39 protein [Gemmatimonadales bacterium]|nr:glycosyltransferase family 39 protein [Gemmatimonadales bacterium]
MLTSGAESTPATPAATSPDPRWRRRASRADLAAGALCLGLLVAGLLIGRAHTVPGYGVETDFAAVYSFQAANLLRGLPYTYSYHPFGYPALLAVLSPLTGGDLFAAGKLLATLAAVTLVATTHLLARALVDRRTALAGTAVLAVAILPYVATAASDLPGAALVQLALWLGLGARRLGPARAFAAGVAAAAAFLVRSSGALAIAAAAAAVLVLAPAERTRRRGQLLAALLAGVLAGLAPAGLYNLATAGRLAGPTELVQVGVSYQTPADSGVSATESAVTGLPSVLRVFASHPVGFLAHYAGRQISLAAPLLARQGLGFPAYLFVGPGLVLLLARRRSPAARRLAVWAGFCLAGYLALGLLDPLIRYYLFLLPFLCLAVAIGALLDGAAGRDGRPLVGRRPGAGIVAAIVLVGLLGRGREVARSLADDPRELLSFAAELRRIAAPGDIIVSRKPQLAYLAGLRYDVAVDPRDLPTLLRDARAHGARWLLYSPRTARLWPALRTLADPGPAPRGLRLVMSDPRSGVRLYELVR